MSDVSVTPAGGGEVIGDSPERRVEILGDHPAVHATWTRFGPGRDGADPHVHRTHTDVFYVLAGELTVKLEGGERAVPAGTLVRVPPMVVHGFRNAADAELRYLNLHAPGAGFAAYMRGIRDGERVGFDQEDPPPEGTRPAGDATIGPPGSATIGPPGGAGDGLEIAELSGPLREDEHAHDGVLEAVYVLAGEVALGDRTAAAGDWLEVAPGAPHALSLGAGARVLGVHAAAP